MSGAAAVAQTTETPTTPTPAAAPKAAPAKGATVAEVDEAPKPWISALTEDEGDENTEAEGQQTEVGEEAEDDFGDDKPWTPDRVKKAAGQAKELLAEAHKQYAAVEKRAAKDKREREKELTERRNFAAIRDLFNADLRALRTGDAATSLAAFGRMLGRDPIKAFEEYSLHVAKNGKSKQASEPSERELKLERKLEELQAKLDGDLQAREDADIDYRLSERKMGIGQLAAQMGEAAPIVAYYAAEDPAAVGERVATLITNFHKAGRKLSDEQAIAILEKRLQAHHQQTQRALGGKTGSPSGGVSGPATRAQANPESARSSPAGKGRSLSVSLSTEVAPTRELTDEEQAEDAAEFLPSWAVNFGRGG